MTHNDFEGLLFVLISDISGIVTPSKETDEMIRYVVPSPRNACVRSGDQNIAGHSQMWSGPTCMI